MANRAVLRTTARVTDPTDAGHDHDRALVRHMLELTPAERLRSVAAYWPLVRVGLVRRAEAGGSGRP